MRPLFWIFRRRLRIATMATEGASAYAISKQLGIDRHTAAKYAEAEWAKLGCGTATAL
jgi:hypothetical protein